MSLTDELQSHLPLRPGDEAIIVQTSLEWTKKLGQPEEAIIVIWTDRQLTTDGGDGWAGLDAKDMNALDGAVQHYIADHGATMVSGFIVRQRRGILPPLEQ